MTNYYLTSRKIHRYFVGIVLILTAIFVLTGLELKFSFWDTGLARNLHNILSPIFAIVLVIMACTGLYMYVYPWYAKRKTNSAVKEEHRK